MAGNTPSNAELAQQIANLTAIITNLETAITNNQVNQAQPAIAPVPHVAPVAFATSPGVAAVEELIDYTSKHGSNLY